MRFDQMSDPPKPALPSELTQGAEFDSHRCRPGDTRHLEVLNVVAGSVTIDLGSHAAVVHHEKRSQSAYNMGLCSRSRLYCFFSSRHGRCKMQAVTGVFLSQADAHRAVESLRSKGVPNDKLTLLTPGNSRKGLESVRVDAAEQPGIGKAIGAALGAAGGVTGGGLLIAAVPGVGWVAAAGMLGAAVLAAAGAGAAAGGALENSTTEGLPEDEIFVYEDALRQGRTVVIALVEDAEAADSLKDLLKSEGAETIDAARHQWWIGLRSAEREHYAAYGKDFGEDERFYRLGFEAALHARWRCKEFDQVSAEMASNLEELQRQHPGAEIEEAYERGYQRGREHYQSLCNESTAA
jgi:hypothetical protein